MKNQINNIPLKQKLLAILLIGVTIMAAMTLLIIQTLSSSYNRMLYQTMADSLSYSAKEITDYMEKMEDLSQIFFSDEKVQQNLTKLKKAYEEEAVQVSILNKMGRYVMEYYQNYADEILNYMSLYTSTSVLKTSFSEADKVPEEVLDKILRAADQKDGALCWSVDYMDEYGLFLARKIRQIEMLKLDDLGILLINLDIDELVKNSTKFEGQYGETAYMICKDGKILYHTENLSDADMEAEMLNLEDIQEYAIRKIGGSSYFISRGEIKDYGWDYYCLVSYKEIESKITGIRHLCLWITIMDLLFVVFVTVRLVGKIMVHISGLKNRMQQFAEDNTRVPEAEFDYSERKDELGMLNQQFDEMSRTIISLIQENYVNEILKKEAQLRALENQINPHFLYNTLDSIKWRAKAAGEKDITAMVEALSILMRAALHTKDKKEHTVGQEAEIVASYITIQKLRYEERLTFENKLEKDWDSFVIPKLVIQPLLENAIFYGLELNVDECHIVLSGEKRDGVLHFYIKNTGSEIEDHLLEKLEEGEIKPHGNGVGLLNINKRIKIQYGKQYGVYLYNEDDYAVAELTIPEGQMKC